VSPRAEKRRRNVLGDRQKGRATENSAPASFFKNVKENSWEGMRPARGIRERSLGEGSPGGVKGRKKNDAQIATLNEKRGRN